jgi:hypothetical protein
MNLHLHAFPVSEGKGDSTRFSRRAGEAELHSTLVVTSTRVSSRAGGKEEKLAIAVVAWVVTSTRISSRGGEEDLYRKKAKYELLLYVFDIDVSVILGHLPFRVL